MIPDRNWWEQFASARLNLEVLLHQCGIALADEYARDSQRAMREARMLNFALQRARGRAEAVLKRHAMADLQKRLSDDPGR